MQVVGPVHLCVRTRWSASYGSHLVWCRKTCVVFYMQRILETFLCGWGFVMRNVVIMVRKKLGGGLGLGCQREMGSTPFVKFMLQHFKILGGKSSSVRHVGRNQRPHLNLQSGVSTVLRHIVNRHSFFQSMLWLDAGSVWGGTINRLLNMSATCYLLQICL